MKSPTERLDKSQALTPQVDGLRGSPHGAAYMRKLDATEWLAMDILDRIENTVQQNPSALMVNRLSMLPRELQEGQEYLLQKVAHARKMLNELSTLLQTRSEIPDVRERIKIELMIFFVLIANYRPETINEPRWKPGADVLEAIRERIESLNLDVINIRERLK
ncbi:MAG TPA: hypothetical protein VMB66_04165 [Candidatus Acidoferrales bacterium]|nr:hypothetical protein [Candidatus Acidoferrales bacterium]